MPLQPPGAIDKLVVTPDASAPHLFAAWSRAAGAVVGYDITISPPGRRSRTNRRNAFLPHLPDGQEVAITVRAFNAAGYGPGTSATAVPGVANPPERPIVQCRESKDGCGIVLTISPGGPTFVGSYAFVQCPVGGSGLVGAVVRGDTLDKRGLIVQPRTRTVSENCVACITKSYCVIARNNKGQSAVAQIACGALPPVPAIQLTAVADEFCCVDLAWQIDGRQPCPQCRLANSITTTLKRDGVVIASGLTGSNGTYRDCVAAVGTYNYEVIYRVHNEVRCERANSAVVEVDCPGGGAPPQCEVSTAAEVQVGTTHFVTIQAHNPNMGGGAVITWKLKPASQFNPSQGTILNDGVPVVVSEWTAPSVAGDTVITLEVSWPDGRKCTAEFTVSVIDVVPIGPS